MTALIDSHCHLDFADFNHDLSHVLNRAKNQGISRILTICTNLSDLPKVLNISESNPEVYFALGAHPLSILKNETISTEKLIEISQHPRMIGIGETGLDYHYTRDTSEQQKISLLAHIRASQLSNLPLIIHSRAADDDMANILSSEYAKQEYSCVMHCFSSGQNLANTAIELGFYLSMSGIVTFPKSESLRQIFSNIPLDRVLVETDSPYLAPVPFRGKRNEPAYVIETAKVGASIFGLQTDVFNKKTTQNFYKLFKKAQA